MEIGTTNTHVASLGEYLWDCVQSYCIVYLYIAMHYPELLDLRFKQNKNSRR